MTDAEFTSLGSAVEDARFSEVDIALRRGRHVDREDADWFAFLTEAQGVLEAFYRRYGCELIFRTDGYYFLLPTSDKLPKRQLSIPEMIVGQAVALLYLDPHTIETQGAIARENILSQLATVMGADALVHAFTGPKRRRVDERVAQESVRAKVAEALRKLAVLGFVDLLEGDRVRLRPALMRFAEPVRGADSPALALEKLVARGEIAMGHSSAGDNVNDDLDAEGLDPDDLDLDANGDGVDPAEPAGVADADEYVFDAMHESDSELDADNRPPQSAVAQGSALALPSSKTPRKSEAPAVAARRKVFDAWELDEDLPAEESDAEPDEADADDMASADRAQPGDG